MLRRIAITLVLLPAMVEVNAVQPAPFGGARLVGDALTVELPSVSVVVLELQ